MAQVACFCGAVFKIVYGQVPVCPKCRKKVPGV